MRIHHIGMQVASVDKAREEYLKYWGFQMVTGMAIGDEVWLFLKKGSLTIELVQGPPNLQPMHLAFAVPEREAHHIIKDLHQHCFELVEAFLLNPYELSLYFADHKGNEIEYICCLENSWFSNACLDCV